MLVLRCGSHGVRREDGQEALEGGFRPAVDRTHRCAGGIDDFSLENQERIVHAWIEQKEYKLGNIMNAWRLTLVGEGKGPGMFDISAFLGKEETIRRMKRAIEVLG